MRFSSCSVRLLGFGSFALLFSAISSSAQVTTAPKQGIRENDPRLHALTNARIVTAPGKTIEKGTVLIRDGVIVDAAPDMKIPAEARVWDLTGKTIYPGFIDAYSRLGLPETLQPEPLRPDIDYDDPNAKPKEVPRESAKGMHSWNPKVTPERKAADYLNLDKRSTRKLRDLGFTSALVVPGRGIFRGSSALIDLQETDVATMIVAPSVAQHIAFDFSRRDDNGAYPTSLMGCIALIRQNFLDAGWYQAAQDAYRKNPATTERPETNASLAALAEQGQRKQPTIFETDDELELLRALRISDEFKLKPILLGNGYEYRVRKALAVAKTPIILSLDFPKAPEIERPEQALDYELDELQHWDRAPSNPARLVEAGIPIAFNAEKLEKPEKEFWSRLRLAVRRGLNKDAALAALTTTPAEMFGVSDRLGTIAPGRIANLVVASGDLFSSEAKVLTTWIDGSFYDTDSATELDPRGTWEIALEGKTLPLIVEGELDKLDAKVGGEKVTLSTKEDTILLVAPAKLFEKGEGSIRLSGRMAGEVTSGSGETPTGEMIRWRAKRTAAYTLKKPDEKPAPLDKPLDFPETYPAGSFGRIAPPEQPHTVLIQGATIWTSGPQDTIPNGDLLVTDGKISLVGSGLKAPAGASIIDGKGLHVTPGIVDCHSHTAISKGVNEGSHAVTCEVRIGDVIDATDIDIYRELAGGVTSANILHGSANPIGGQNQIIKFRWGALPEELKFVDAMPGVKFALGENVKQSNWGDKYKTRYPQTRMGVEQLIRDRFRAALEYDAAQKKKDGLPPRRDLQLEALLEIVNGKRLIHCHSYRQDEVLTLLRVAGEFKIKIGTFQHILEGYKVADEIAKHGAGGSTFADWWAYKWEAFDAIPYNAGMMQSRGVLTSVNSDSGDLARRLNTEAGKSTKYGGMAAEEALKLVTIYPARQLHIEGKTGSLEPGKDADFVIWSGNPLSNYTSVRQTWVDGRKYFDRAEDAEARKAVTAQREALIQKALPERMKELGAGGGDSKDKKPDGKEAKPTAHSQHRAHELEGLYGNGADKHTCTEGYEL